MFLTYLNLRLLSLRYESSTPTFQELSSHIFPVRNMKEYNREICYTSRILTKYKTLTVSALHWLSATKYQPLLSYIDPVHTVSSSRNAQLNQLDLVVVAFTHMLVCAGLQTDPFELLVVFCTRGLKQIGLKWNFSSFLSTICLPIPFYQYTHNWLTDWRTERCRLKWSTAWSKLARPEKIRKGFDGRVIKMSPSLRQDPCSHPRCLQCTTLLGFF